MSGAEEVLTFLRLLWKSPKSRRRWRVLECHCPRCGELAIEVFRTPAASAPLVAVHFGVKTLDMEPGKLYPLGIQHKGVRASDPTVSALSSELQDGLEVAGPTASPDRASTGARSSCERWITGNSLPGSGALAFVLDMIFSSAEAPDRLKSWAHGLTGTRAPLKATNY